MINYYSKFYQDLYLNSGGYIPLWPLKRTADLGDLFLIRYGYMIKIGNILEKYFDIYEDVHIEEDIEIDWNLWNIDSGVSYAVKSGIMLGERDGFVIPEDRHALMLDFEDKGSYFFRTAKIKEKCISNFHDFSFKLLQFLASEKFSFKEIFVLTSVAKVDDYAMMVASAANASAMISIDSQAKVPHNLSAFAKLPPSFQIEYMNQISTFHISEKGNQMFFKAQKLEASSHGKELIKKYINEQLPESMKAQAANILRFAPTEVLPANELFPSKVHELFRFRGMNLNDVSMFLGE